MSQPPKAAPVTVGRTLAAIAMCSAAAGILSIATPHTASKSDFVSYWAAGHQLAHRLNPYDGTAILHLQQQAGVTKPFFMRNPPWAFWIALPLGFSGIAAGSFFWSCAILAGLMVSVRLFWNATGVNDDDLRIVSYAFAPAVFCLMQQQTSIFLLFGFVLFFYWRESRPFLAGAALLLPAAKPHLWMPFGIVVLLWSVVRRRYTVLAGLVVATLASLALAFNLDPACFQHYNAMVRGADIQEDFIPSLSQLFRLLISRNLSWLQVLPAAVACLWAIWYFWRRRTNWNWMTDGALVLLVSVATAPYAWFADQSLMLIAIMGGLAFAANKNFALLSFGVLTAIPFAEMMFGVAPRSWWYVWTTPAWLLWYVYVMQNAVPEALPAEPVSQSLYM